MIKAFVIAAAFLFVAGVVLGLGAWAIVNVWPIVLIVLVGGGGTALYIRQKRAKNTV
jgi:hypothetical protein